MRMLTVLNFFLRFNHTTESSQYGHEASQQDCLEYAFDAKLEPTEGGLEILDRGSGDFKYRDILIVRIHHDATEFSQ
jgi:hypothetical protein